MNTLYYNLTGAPNPEKEVTEIYEALKVSKGNTLVKFDFNNITKSGCGIMKIVVDFGDDSPIHIKESSIDGNYDILNESIYHTYKVDPNYDYNSYIPTMYITYLNKELEGEETNNSTFSTLVIEAPIRISRPSFHGEHKSLTVSSIQLIDEPEDPVFTTFQTANGDILNLKIK